MHITTRIRRMTLAQRNARPSPGAPRWVVAAFVGRNARIAAANNPRAVTLPRLRCLEEEPSGRYVMLPQAPPAEAPR